MKIETTSKWDEAFFKDFINFRNKIHQDIPTSFPETMTDYEKYFGEDSVFHNDYFWEAFLVKENEVVVAKAILCSKKQSKCASLGFIDWENHQDASKLLVDAVVDSAKRNNLSFIKSPVDLNFFIKYRIRTPGGGEPFWGEPIYPDYYHDLFRLNGFSVIGEWDTYEVKIFQNIFNYFKKRKESSRNQSGSLVVRHVRMNDWNNELKIIYDLFNRSYRSMPDWEEITFEQFKLIYDDFKYIINPLYAYIVEENGIPVAFNINFADPLPILAHHKGKKLSPTEKALVFLKLKLNRSQFLIAHIGKVPNKDGEEIKGIQVRVSRKIQFYLPFMKKVLVTFQMKDSPSRRAFRPESLIPHAHYVLYGKKIL